MQPRPTGMIRVLDAFNRQSVVDASRKLIRVGSDMIEITLRLSDEALDRACFALERPPSIPKEQHIQDCLERLLNQAVYHAERDVWAKAAEAEYNQGYKPVTEVANDAQ